MLKRIFISLSILATVCSGAKAQKSQNFINHNAWLNQTTTWSISPKWSIHQEIQWRRNDYYNRPQQTLLRAGLTRDLGNGLSATAGYCFVFTSPYGAIPAKGPFNEQRLWQQLQQKNTHKNIELVTRLRLEERWVETPSKVSINNVSFAAGDNIFSYRARFMEKVNIALTSRQQPFQNNCLYFSMMDEYFASFGTNITTNIFDQNRAFVGLGYVLPKLGRLEVGYMNQTINKGYSQDEADSRILSKREVNHTLSVALYTTIKTWKPEAPKN